MVLFNLQTPTAIGIEVLLLQWADMPPFSFDTVELFSGVGNVSAAHRKLGKRVASFDKSYSDDSSMDFTSPSGFVSKTQ